ncbi:MAG TPA: TonB family protein [Thermoanaerobaculia bacterium]|jgi:protein TonB
MDVVGNILAERRADRFSWAPATLLAFLLHAGILAGILASALARPMRFAAPRAVAVRLLPAGSLRAPEPARSQPALPAAEKPKIEKPSEEAPPPSKKAVLLPSKEEKRKPTPPPVSRPGRAATPSVSLPSTGDESSGATAGSAAGAGGTAGIGSLRLDQADFKYPVYIERLVMIISLNWFKPAQQVTVNPIIHFQIERDGTITDPRIVTSSGLPFVDRAALRAVLASSPLPPLPAEYGGPHLGIQVVFE